MFLREGYTVKFFFQGISWNTVSGSFHETWNNFMKYFYFSIQHSEAVVQMCSVEKVFLEIAQNSQENTCTRASFLIKLQVWGQSLFFNKVAGLRPATLLKKSLWHRCFPVNFVEFLRTHFLTQRLWWLLLNIHCVCFSSIRKLCLLKKDVV